jgi:hypothetical protein
MGYHPYLGVGNPYFIMEEGIHSLWGIFLTDGNLSRMNGVSRSTWGVQHVVGQLRRSKMQMTCQKLYSEKITAYVRISTGNGENCQVRGKSSHS